MKKFTFAKIIVLFALILCIITIFVITIRNRHYKIKEEENAENIEEILEQIKDEENTEKEIFNKEMLGIIIIESIGVKAPIYEKAEKETLKYAVRSF